MTLDTHAACSSYNYVLNNPLTYIDPDGRENIPALIWAAKKMANKNIPFQEWYGGNGGWIYEAFLQKITICSKQYYTFFFQP